MFGWGLNLAKREEPLDGNNLTANLCESISERGLLVFYGQSAFHASTVSLRTLARAIKGQGELGFNVYEKWVERIRCKFLPRDLNNICTGR